MATFVDDAKVYTFRDLAAIFQVPEHMLAPAVSTDYSEAGDAFIRYMDSHIRPWLDRWMSRNNRFTLRLSRTRKPRKYRHLLRRTAL